MSGLVVEVSDVNGVKVFRLDGRVDAASASQLEAKLEVPLEEGKPKVLLDFSSVEYLSSAGMRLLLSSTKKAAAKDGVFAVCSLGDEVMEIIKMAGFERILRLFSNEKTALESMS